MSRRSWEQILAQELFVAGEDDARDGLPITNYKAHAPRRDKKAFQEWYDMGWNGYHDDRRRGYIKGVPGDADMGH